MAENKPPQEERKKKDYNSEFYKLSMEAAKDKKK
jgi:hypothetical protein